MSSSNASQLLRGYDLLSKVSKEAFEQSVPGQTFLVAVQSYDQFLEKIQQRSWFSLFYSTDPADMERRIETERKRQKKELKRVISATPEYQAVVLEIQIASLQNALDIYPLMTDAQQKALRITGFTQELLHTLSRLDLEIGVLQKKKEHLGLMSRLLGNSVPFDAQIALLDAKRITAIQNWNYEFSMVPDYETYKKTIDENKAALRKQALEKQHALFTHYIERLGSFFPLLRFKKYPSDRSFVENILETHKAQGSLDIDYQEFMQETLETELGRIMQNLMCSEQNFVRLEAFNTQKAHALTVEILRLFNNKSVLDLNRWFQAYENKLYQYYIKQLRLIHGKAWKAPRINLEDFKESLSCLWENPAAEQADIFFHKLSDAHAFIQATGFATQNESSYFSILDLYNYSRYAEQIAEWKKILASLFSLFKPIYDEYKDIALHEKNGYMKAIRIMIPILIVIGVIVIISAFMVPLALPEIASVVVFVGALILGLFMTTLYLSVKNQCYQKIREWYYGGPFEIPEFQINQRMCAAFGNEEKARLVRDFYIEELKKCQAIERGLTEKQAHGLLSQEDITLRKENTKKQCCLNLDWYDIHENHALEVSRARDLAVSRLQKAAHDGYQVLESAIKSHDEGIRQSVTNMTDLLKKAIVSPEASPQPLEDTMTTIYTVQRLFAPRNIQGAKGRVEQLAHVAVQCSSP